VAVCLTCHTDQAEQGQKAHAHQPAFVQGCATCHEPHGGDNVHLLRAATPNALCLECHAPDVEPAQLESEHMVAIFDKKVKLPENYFGKVPLLPLKYGAGHPVEKHPITDQKDPKDPTKTITVNCLVCHQPHSSAQPGLLVKDQSNGMAFCKTCHATNSLLGRQ
jgi:predicted CXXCH cytochrome family protein